MRPLVVLAFGTFCFSLDSTLAALTDDGDELQARKIVAAAIDASGGKKAMEKAVSYSVKANGRFFRDGEMIPFVLEYWQQNPNQMRTVIQIDSAAARHMVIRVLNGNSAWEKRDDTIRVLGREQVTALRENVFRNWLTKSLYSLIEDPKCKLTYLGESQDGDRSELGVRVSYQGMKEFSLYFDKISKLLAKRKSPSFRPEGDVEHLEFFSSYKEISGLWVPMKLISYVDGKKDSEDHITELSFKKSLEPTLFERP